MQIFGILKIANFWNFKNCKFSEFATLQIFGIFKIKDFANFLDCKFSKFSKSKTFGVFQIEIFLTLPNCKFFKFFKSKIFRIFQVWSFWNCPNWKIKKFWDFFNSENQIYTPKTGSFGIVYSFDIPHYSEFCQFSYLPFDINQFRRFNFSTFIPHSSGNFLDWQIHKKITSLKLFSFKN